MTNLRSALLSLVLACAAQSVCAQTAPTHYNLHDINYDLWCQETMHYSAERCDKRLPKDDADFKAYRELIENYELKRLERQRAYEARDSGIAHRDTLDQPGEAPTQPGSEGTIPNPH